MASVLDTNVLLRFLVGDHPRQQAQARRWFKEAEAGKRAIIVHPLIVAEACFVLETFYETKRAAIADAMEAFVGQEWLLISEREALLGLWSWYRQGLHFVDSFLLSWASLHEGDILTFDQQMKKKSPV